MSRFIASEEMLAEAHKRLDARIRVGLFGILNLSVILFGCWTMAEWTQWFPDIWHMNQWVILTWILLLTFLGFVVFFMNDSYPEVIVLWLNIIFFPIWVPLFAIVMVTGNACAFIYNRALALELRSLREKSKKEDENGH